MINKLVECVDADLYDYVLGVGRGGLVPAVYISNKLNISMLVIAHSSKSGNGDGANEFAWLNIDDIDDDSNVLIVDDICDTGYTLKEIRDYIRMLTNGIVHTATLHWRESSILEPDVWIKKLKSDDPWVVYDWE